MLKKIILGIVVSALSSLASTATLAGNDAHYQVTITNLTRGQTFTPVLVASHRSGVNIFKLGEAASAELTAIAEGGDVGPLTAELEVNPKVKEVANSGGLLGPGESVSVEVSARHASRISIASMLIPTNDAFIGLNSVAAPKRLWHSRTYVVGANDAGVETNDELCISIPGPVCGGAGGSPADNGEGYIHTHAGIHGIGDLPAAQYDWRNPVAKIVIRKVH